MEPTLILALTGGLVLAGVTLAALRPARPLLLAPVLARRSPGVSALATAGTCCDLADAAATCRRCERQDACQAWLARNAAEPCPSFCPNRAVIEGIGSGA